MKSLYLKNLMQAIAYMEENLGKDLALGDIAEAAAYSPFHFTRLFRSVTGQTPYGYLRKRRLTEAALELASGNKRVIEIAINYCFGSQEAFTRAFKEVFGVTPATYRQNPFYLHGTCIAPFTKHYLINCLGGIEMDPVFEKIGVLKLIGMAYYGDNKDMEISKVWDEFNPLTPSLGYDGESPCYGICFYSSRFAQTGRFYYLAAVAVESLDQISMPITMLGKILPSSEYAVFKHQGSAEKIRDTYSYIYGKWLPDSGYENPFGYDFERYGKDFKMDWTGSLDICIPIAKKS